MIYDIVYFVFWPAVVFYKVIRQSVDTWARLYLYSLLFVYNQCGIKTEFDSKIESETTKSLGGFPSFLGFGGTWWNDAIQKTWPQLSLVATDKILVFLNHIFHDISTTSNVIETLQVKSIFLGSKGPLISNIKISSHKNDTDEVSLDIITIISVKHTSPTKQSNKLSTSK
jgi:phosphatidylserine synthase